MRNLKNNSIMERSAHKKQKLLFLIIGMMCCLTAKAQEEDGFDNHFTLSGQLRPRAELSAGAYQPLQEGEKPAALISDRIRLNLDYSWKGALTTKISLQSVGIWGQPAMVQNPESSGNQFSVFEAWAKLRLAAHWDVKVGRQVISLDDERFFGALDWAQGARSHDAVEVLFSKGKLEARGYLAYNQNYRELYSNNINNPVGNLYSSTGAYPHKWMQTLWLGAALNKQSKLSLLATNLGFQNALKKSDTVALHWMQTFGANFFHNGKKLSASLSAYFQTGENTAGTKTSAYLLAAYLGYKPAKGWSIGLGSDYVSGNDVGTPMDDNRAFTPFFGTNHKFYGAMDYYFVGNGHRNAGLWDNYLTAAFKTSQRLSLNLAAHQFFSSGDVTEAGKEYDKDLGQEADFGFQYRINGFAGLAGGYSCYLVTPTLSYLKATPRANDMQHWLWLTLNVAPDFFTTKF